MYRVLVTVSLLETHLRHSLIDSVIIHNSENSDVLWPRHNVSNTWLFGCFWPTWFKIVPATIRQYHLISPNISHLSLVLIRPAHLRMMATPGLFVWRPTWGACSVFCHLLPLSPLSMFPLLPTMDTSSFCSQSGPFSSWWSQPARSSSELILIINSSACTLWIGTKTSSWLVADRSYLFGMVHTLQVYILTSHNPSQGR